MTKIDPLNISLSVGNRELEPNDIFRRQTWPSVVCDFGPPDRDVYVLRLGQVDPQDFIAFHYRDYVAQYDLQSSSKDMGQVWRPADKTSDDREVATAVKVGRNFTVSDTNNLQATVLCEGAFNNLAVTTQINPLNNHLCVIVEKTWHGRIFRDKSGKVRVPDLERKGSERFDHPLLSVMRKNYGSDELPELPPNYPLWADKILYSRLHEGELVVIAMDTPLDGGIYYARNRNKQFVKIRPHQILEGCPFLTVGTILKKKEGGYMSLPEDRCAEIFFGRLDYRPEKKPRNRLHDIRRGPAQKDCVGTNMGVVSLEEAFAHSANQA